MVLRNFMNTCWPLAQQSRLTNLDETLVGVLHNGSNLPLLLVVKLLDPWGDLSSYFTRSSWDLSGVVYSNLRGLLVGSSRP